MAADDLPRSTNDTQNAIGKISLIPERNRCQENRGIPERLRREDMPRKSLDIRFSDLSLCPGGRHSVASALITHWKSKSIYSFQGSPEPVFLTLVFHRLFDTTNLDMSFSATLMEKGIIVILPLDLSLHMAYSTIRCSFLSILFQNL